jgi:carboxylesterase
MTYDRAVAHTIAAFRRFDDADGARVADGLHSRVHLHDAPARRTIVLLHGLTASPLAYEKLGLELHAEGANVIVPRIPRHGHSNRMTETLRYLHADEITHFADAMIDAIVPLGGRIEVLGHSLGGLMACYVAHTRDEVFRAIPLAPFLGILPVPYEAHGPFFAGVKRLPNTFLWWNPIARANQVPTHGYPRYPTHAIAVMTTIADALRERAIREPLRAQHVDMLLNASEASINNRTARELAARWERTRPGAARVHTMTGLPPSHDVIEPLKPASLYPRVYPLLRRMLAEPQTTDTTHAV